MPENNSNMRNNENDKWQTESELRQQYLFFGNSNTYIS